MKRLPIKLRKNGYDYTQVYRSEKVAIYEQADENTTYGYEVFEIKTQNAAVWGKIKFEARERFPHNEAFGNWAWAVPTLERAMRKAKELEERIMFRLAA